MTMQTLTTPSGAFAVVVADTADWLADKLVSLEARGMSRPGGADRFRQRAHAYRARPSMFDGTLSPRSPW